MEMDKFNADWWSLKEFREQFEMGHLNLQPAYQRSRVWSDEQRYSLIESVSQGFPIGLVMLNVIDKVEDDVPVKHYDVVDGQQRVRTIIEYITATESWSRVTNRRDFQPFITIKAAVQQNFYRYKIPIALMTKFDDDDINEIYARLQKGKPLKPGEKLKSMTSAPLYNSVQALTTHKIFDLSDGALKVRDSHWMLATACFKASYTGDLFGRMEFLNLHRFLKDEKFDGSQNLRSLDSVRKILNFEQRVIVDGLELWPDFARYARTARAVKWLFFSLYTLLEQYTIGGKEHDAARGVVSYYKSIQEEHSSNWAQYLSTGRTGRVDTEEVKACIAELSNQIINATSAEPKDPRRNFTRAQRQEIFEVSGGQCQQCRTSLSKANFHADHKHPHSRGGQTAVSNGRALCSGCNRKIGNRWRESRSCRAATEPAPAKSKEWATQTGDINRA